MAGAANTKDKKDMEGRNVTMLPTQWDVVDEFATNNGLITARGPNTSQALRQIVREWQSMKRHDHDTITRLVTLLKDARQVPANMDED